MKEFDQKLHDKNNHFLAKNLNPKFLTKVDDLANPKRFYFTEKDIGASFKSLVINLPQKHKHIIAFQLNEEINFSSYFCKSMKNINKTCDIIIFNKFDCYIIDMKSGLTVNKEQIENSKIFLEYLNLLINRLQNTNIKIDNYYCLYIRQHLQSPKTKAPTYIKNTKISSPQFIDPYLKIDSFFVNTFKGEAIIDFKDLENFILQHKNSLHLI